MAKRRKRLDVAPKFRPSPDRGHGEDWIYGAHAVRAALANPRRAVRRLLATAQTAGTLGAAAIAPEIVSREEISRLLPPGAVHQGIALEAAPLAATGLEDLVAALADAERSVVVVLDRVTDPHNVGAILRSAAAFGARALIVPERHGAEMTGVLAKAASGALEIVPVIRVVNLVRALERLKAAKFWCVGLDAQAPGEIECADLTGRIAIVLGAEGTGLRRLTREHCDILVRLPMTGSGVPSLNVSTAAAIALYLTSRKA